MNNRLSYSSVNKYLFCGEAFRLHYREGYRPKTTSSALLFGKALDNAFGYILTGKNESDQEVANEYEYFDYYWRMQYINDVPTNLFDNPNGVIVYSKYDIDYDLLTQEEKREAKSDQDKIAWFSMRHKGHLMIDAFKRDFLPLVEKIYSTQELIELENEDGDKSIGYCDCVAKLKGYDKPIILDFKTAARPYVEDSVEHSVQLSQYLHFLSDKYENTRLAGYVVFIKNIAKNKTKVCAKCGFDGSGTKFKTCNNEVGNTRCNGDWEEKINPKCEMQLLVNEIPQSVENFVIDNIATVNHAIKCGIFTKNVNGCRDAGFGRPCDFYEKCWKNKEESLVKVEVKK